MVQLGRRRAKKKNVNKLKERKKRVRAHSQAKNVCTAQRYAQKTHVRHRRVGFAGVLPISRAINHTHDLRSLIIMTNLCFYNEIHT